MKSASSWLGIELSVVSLREKIISLLGGLLSILLLMAISGHALHLPYQLGLIASMGASAVLLFAVPHGQLSQPWPVIGGHALAAIIGVSCARWIGSTEVAAACAVAFTIFIMHQLKCIHPPGGATALTAVLGGPAIHELGFRYVLCPVLVNCLVMVAVAVAFNAFFPWRRYPAAWSRTKQVNTLRTPPSHAEIVAALRELDSFVDISEDDLIQLIQILRGHRGEVKTER